MSQQSNKKGILKGIILTILLVAVGYAIYSQVVANDKEGASSNEKVAPGFVLNDLKGKKYDLADYRGKGVLINFWATYCPPCEKEMPYLESAYQDYKDQGVEILAVNAEEPSLIVNQFAAKQKLSFPILLDRDGEVLDKYHVQNLPITFLVNKDGVIEDQVFGEMTEDDIRGYLKQIKPE